MVLISVFFALLVAIVTFYLLQWKDVNVKLQIVIDEEKENVFAFWIDIENMKRVHPFVQSVEKIEQDTDDMGEQSRRFEHFTVEDRVDYIPVVFPYTFSRQVRKSDEAFVIECFTSPLGGLLHLNATLVFSAIDEGVTKVEEFLHIKVLRIFEAFTSTQATKAHQAILEKSKQILEQKP